MAATTIMEFDKARGKFKNVLEKSLVKDDVEALLTFVDSYQDDIGLEKRTVLDQVFRDILCKMISDTSNAELLKSVITFAIQAVRQDMCSPSTPFLMMADIFDMLTIERCEAIFDLVEDKVTVWKSEPFYESGKNYLLRMCNDLIRRLSKSQNTVFCGRIQLFLSRLFPLSEKSALNLASQFNLDNLTVYAKQDTSDETKEEIKNETMDVDDVQQPRFLPDGEDNNRFEDMNELHQNIMYYLLACSIPIDYHLYRKFWALQDFFRRPTQCYEKASWETFSQYAGDVLSIFASYKLDDVSFSQKKSPIPHQAHQHAQNFFAKYLTSEKLLNLQLSDSNFRRYVLVQFLIIFQYLRATIKFKTAAHSLTDEQSDWIRECQEKVVKLLCETPPDGEQFCNSVKHILEREEHWNSWKNDSCPSFIRDKAKEQSKTKAKPKRKRIGDDLLASGGKSLKLGNPELTRLWNLNPDNMEACKAESRVFLPKLDEFFANAIEQADPEAMVEDQYKDINQQNFQWKAYRLLARSSPHFFVHTNTPGLPITVHLKEIVDKMAREINPNLHTSEVKSEVTVNNDEDEIKENQDDHDSDDMRNAEDDVGSPQLQLTKDQIRIIAEQAGSLWMKLGERLGLPADHLAYFRDSSDNVVEVAVSMLTVWQEEEPERDSISAIRDALADLGLGKVLASLHLS